MKRYRGKRLYGKRVVTVNRANLSPRFDLGVYSVNGFEWGYGGNGAAQLALAILADCLGDDFALHNYEDFKKNVISILPYEGWYLTEQQVRGALGAL